MKRKRMAPRNPFVAAALFRKAGEHRKESKALRRAAKVELRGRSFEVKQPAFNRQIRDRWPCAPTRNYKRMTMRPGIVVSRLQLLFLDSSVGRAFGC